MKIQMRKNKEPQLTTTTTAKTNLQTIENIYYSAPRNAFRSSDPERLSRDIDRKDGLSVYCRFYGYTVEECVNLPPPDNSPRPNLEWQMIFFQLENPLLIGLLFTIITMISLFSTIFFVLLILKRRKDFQYPIYIIIMNLSISYSLVAVSQCFLNIPLYLVGMTSVPNKDDFTIRQITYFIDQFADFSAVLFYFMLAVNRLAILSCEPLKRLFQGKTKNITIGVGWMLALMASLFTVWYGCMKTFDDDRVLFYNDCLPPSRFVLDIYKVIFYIYYALPVISFLIYIYIGIWIAATRNSIRNKGRRIEVDLLLQSAITLLFYMAILVLYFLQFDFTNDQKFVYIFDMFINGLEVSMGILFVSVFAIGNKSVRRAARKMCFYKRTSVTPVKDPIVLRNGTRSN